MIIILITIFLIQEVKETYNCCMCSATFKNKDEVMTKSGVSLQQPSQLQEYHMCLACYDKLVRNGSRKSQGLVFYYYY